MKLVVAIVHDDDAYPVIESLTEANFSITKLASTGGFLKAGNTTFFTAVQKEKVDDVIKIIKNASKTRKEITTTSPMLGSNSNPNYIPIPIEVLVGGATIFVVDIERFEKV